jgi:hypothetical protein
VIGTRPWFLAAGGLTRVITQMGFFLPDFMNIERHSNEPAAALQAEGEATSSTRQRAEGIAI